MGNLKESDLYAPVKAYLDSLGYDTKGEVKNCDIAAVKDGELIVVELKKGFTLELIYQALERQKYADGVYVAVPMPKGGYTSAKYKDMVYLCKRLEIGLILVGFSTKGTAQIDVALNPAEAKPVRKNKKKRIAVLTEHNNRTGSVNTGGVTRRKIITAYKEQALAVANTLYKHGELKAEEIKQLCGCEKTSAILCRNFYGWYEKSEDNGNRSNKYRVTEKGIAAVMEYRDLL